MCNRPERTRYIREKKKFGSPVYDLEDMMSGHRYPPLDHNRATPLPHHLVYLSQCHHTMLYLWDALRFAVSRVLPSFLYTLWDMVFHAISAPLNHLISTHIGMISYLLHIVSTISINHYISHISYILYSFILFYTRYCIFIASAFSPPGISWHILYTYPTSCIGTISCTTCLIYLQYLVYSYILWYLYI